jgi:hypothetical protein
MMIPEEKPANDIVHQHFGMISCACMLSGALIIESLNILPVKITSYAPRVGHVTVRAPKVCDFRTCCSISQHSMNSDTSLKHYSIDCGIFFEAYHGFQYARARRDV